MNQFQNLINSQLENIKAGFAFAFVPFTLTIIFIIIFEKKQRKALLASEKKPITANSLGNYSFDGMIFLLCFFIAMLFVPWNLLFPKNLLPPKETFFFLPWGFIFLFIIWFFIRRFQNLSQILSVIITFSIINYFALKGYENYYRLNEIENWKIYTTYVSIFILFTISYLGIINLAKGISDFWAYLILFIWGMCTVPFIIFYYSSIKIGQMIGTASAITGAFLFIAFFKKRVSFRITYLYIGAILIAIYTSINYSYFASSGIPIYSLPFHYLVGIIGFLLPLIIKKSTLKKKSILTVIFSVAWIISCLLLSWKIHSLINLN